MAAFRCGQRTLATLCGDLSYQQFVFLVAVPTPRAHLNQSYVWMSILGQRFVAKHGLVRSEADGAHGCGVSHTRTAVCCPAFVHRHCLCRPRRRPNVS